MDIPAAWSAVDARVLVLRGQFDEVAVEANHARIAALVNAGHPGRATHQSSSPGSLLDATRDDGEEPWPLR